MVADFREIARCLEIPDPVEKVSATRELWRVTREQGLKLDMDDPATLQGPPGRPERPGLVEPSAVPRRRLGTSDGRAALVHAIAHIEFNAINLALDAALRFRQMPEQYYLDWLSVAADEARHFGMLAGRLAELGHGYGDFPAHNGLWEMAEKTSGSCLERMALVPRVLEARGLDVTPGMIKRLRAVGDDATINLLEVILEEEVRHVAIGSHWFRYCCAEQGVAPEPTFRALLGQHFTGKLRGPFNTPYRIRAGFSEQEMEELEKL
jgi:uncharacterized ferritin-like protein (DUF455 family)